MEIISLKQSFTLPDKGSVLSVGNFDGVHRGHAVLIEEVVSNAQKHGLTSVILTFEPHTRAVLFPDTTQPVLSTLQEKTTLIESYGIEYLVYIPFDASFAALSAETFVRQILFQTLKAVYWVMGEGHTFGKNHTGNNKFSHSLEGKNDINKVLVKSLALGNRVISSTEIRAHIVNGRFADAIHMLGHPYLIRLRRTAGVKKATGLGYPTMNFSSVPSNKVLPPPGIFAAKLEYKNKQWLGALYFGQCPTFGNREAHFEFHAFDYSEGEPAQGEQANLWIYQMIRTDTAFGNDAELTEAIKRDIVSIQHFFLQEKEKCR